MSNDKGSGINFKFLITVIIIVSIWDYFLRGFYHGFLGFRLIIIYSSFRILHSIIHNIHYNHFVSIYNPFFILLIFGGYYMLNKTYKYTHISLIQGLEWFEWFNQNGLSRKETSVLKQVITLPCFIYSCMPYYVLFKNIFSKKMEDNTNEHVS